MLINSKEDLRKAVDQLLEWDEAYNNNNPLVSDKEYDDLYFQVAEAEKNLGMTFDDSPTQRINYEVKDKLEKVTDITQLKPGDKIISIGFEHDFKTGDVFEWCNTGTYWLIYLQDLTELAYFRGDIRKCSY